MNANSGLPSTGGEKRFRWPRTVSRIVLILSAVAEVWLLVAVVLMAFRGNWGGVLLGALVIAVGGGMVAASWEASEGSAL